MNQTSAISFRLVRVCFATWRARPSLMLRAALLAIFLWAGVPNSHADTDLFGGTVVGDNMKKSAWFGHYTYDTYPLVYQYNLGYEYVYDAGNGGVYLYDYTSGDFWYTEPSYFPTVYDFTLQSYLYHYAGNSNARYFYDFASGRVISNLGELTITSVIYVTPQGGITPDTFAYQITATGKPTSYGVTGQLPEGLSLDQNTGLISGSTSAIGDFDVIVSATNGVETGTQKVTFDVPRADSGGGSG